MAWPGAKLKRQLAMAAALLTFEFWPYVSHLSRCVLRCPNVLLSLTFRLKFSFLNKAKNKMSWWPFAFKNSNLLWIPCKWLVPMRRKFHVWTRLSTRCSWYARWESFALESSCFRRRRCNPEDRSCVRHQDAPPTHCGLNLWKRNR